MNVFVMSFQLQNFLWFKIKDVMTAKCYSMQQKLQDGGHKYFIFETQQVLHSGHTLDVSQCHQTRGIDVFWMFLLSGELGNNFRI